jgi:CRISPR system Cascade subunit CasE
MSRLLSKAMLRRDLSVDALRGLLVPQGHGARAGASHHLVWSLFSDSADRDRDFLWREHAPGEFYLLSEREPIDRHGLFDLLPSKLYSPELQSGDQLRFELRANATVSRSTGLKTRGVRSDIVMHAIHGLRGGARAEARRTAVQQVAVEWFSKQGERHGFSVHALDVRAYDVLEVARSGAAPATFGILDLGGIVQVQDPARFGDVLSNGIGRAKAFGCGLMMVRRA